MMLQRLILPCGAKFGLVLTTSVGSANLKDESFDIYGGVLVSTCDKDG